MKRAIYAASLDPLTCGHLNIIERSFPLFDELIVGIGVNPDKHYTFTLNEREAIARQVLKRYGDRVKVKSFPGLLSDFAYENGIDTVIRGARNSADFDFERLLKDINQGFRQGIETIIYIADQNLSHISSSAAKELVRNQAKNLLEYVPLIVKKALERRLRDQCLIGVTGEIACGKSYVTDALRRWDIERTSSVLYESRIHNIDLDDLGREILEKADGEIYKDTRKVLADYFGKDILLPDGMISTPALSEKIFSDEGKMRVFNNIMREPMLLLLRRRLMALKGIVLIDSALIAEAGISTLVNNDVILVRCSREKQIYRMEQRGYPKEKIEQRLAAQLPYGRKKEYLQHQIEEERCGTLIEFDNEGFDDKEAIRSLYKMIEDRIINNVTV
jgi:pantetheine-phosphate adenylyltransferase